MAIISGKAPWGCIVLCCLGLTWIFAGLTLGPGGTPGIYKSFLYIKGEPNYRDWNPYPFGRPKRYPPEDPFRGVRFPQGSVLEILQEDRRTFTVTSWQGQPFTFDKEFSIPGMGVPIDTVDHEVLKVPWDTRQDRPICLSDPRNSIRQYFLWVAKYPLILWVALLGVVLLAAVERRAILWLLPVILVLAILVPKLAEAGNVHADSECEFRASLPGYRTNDGRIRPVSDYRIITPYGTEYKYGFGNLPRYGSLAQSQSIALSCLCLAHTLLALLVFPAIKGAHYLLVPHPAEAHVRRRPGKLSEIDKAKFADSLHKEDINNPSPDFVLENKGRRIRNLTNLLRDEREAAEEAIRHQRVRRAAEREEE